MDAELIVDVRAPDAGSARLIEQAPALLALAEYWADLPSTNPDLPQDVLGFCRHARDIVTAVRATAEEPMVLDRRENPAA